MKKLIVLTLTVFLIGCFSVTMATETEQPGPTIKAAEEQAKAPVKSKEMLQQEYQTLQWQRQAQVNQLNQFLTQAEWLKLRIPALNSEIQEIEAQMRKKLSEIQALEQPEKK